MATRNCHCLISYTHSMLEREKYILDIPLEVAPWFLVEQQCVDVERRKEKRQLNKPRTRECEVAKYGILERNIIEYININYLST
jgi:hypothetical protein